MNEIVITRRERLKADIRESEKGFGFTEYSALPAGLGRHCKVSFYELPPRHANYPYHYHLDQEEVFYIISGHGVLKTPDGDRPVQAGDLIFCPSGEGGAHRLTNTSDTETMVYLDFDTVAAMDVTVYPDSRKIGVWGARHKGVYRLEDRVDYYDREDAGKS